MDGEDCPPPGFALYVDKNADKVPGAKQFTPVVTLTVHLPIGGSGH